MAIQLAVLGACLPLAGAGAEGQSHLALVIGNGAYTGLPALPNCVTSAHIVTAALQRAGYAVTEQVDESNGRLGAAVGDFQDALAAAPDSAAVLYACGYAVGFDGRVFFLPVSATLERPTDALTQGLVGKTLIGAMVRSKIKAGLVLLDTVARAGSDAIPFAGLVDGKTMGNVGFVADAATGTQQQGLSPMATAVFLAFTQPNVEVKATVQALRSALSGRSAAGVVSYEPDQPAYLAGSPPPPAAEAPAPPVPPASASTAPAVMNTAERRRMQLSLQRLGYFHGRVTGAIGADTAAAIRSYQAETGATPTGELTAVQLTQLLDAGR